MSWRELEDVQADRWEPWPRPTVRDTGGPVRTVDDEPHPDFVPRPVGFTATRNVSHRDDVEPQLWEGDQA